MTPPGSDEGQSCAPHPLLWASPPNCHYARRPATPGISHSRPATTGRPLNSPPTRPDLCQLLCRQDQDLRQLLHHRQLLCRTRPRPLPVAVTTKTIASCCAIKTKTIARCGAVPLRPRRSPEKGGEEKNCHVSTAYCAACSSLRTGRREETATSVQPRGAVLSAVCCRLSAAAAAATCVCRTSLCNCMYYALKYSLCLALFVYGYANPAGLPY